MIIRVLGALLAAAPAAGGMLGDRAHPSAPSAEGPVATRAAAVHPPGPDAWTSLDPGTRERVLQSLLSRSLQQRLLEVSRRFLNTPYVISPLGEGKGRDADPTIRFDAVDCLTFVEETIALSLARRPEEVEPLLRELRYGREVRYEDRNHLMEAQWLPNNLRKGFLRDITRRHGGEDTLSLTKRLTPVAWKAPLARLLDLPPDRHVTGDFPLNVIPLDRVVEKAPRFPPGSILVVVREDAPFRVTRVTHLGFVVHKKGRVFLRHAAMSVFGRVVDEDIESFVGRNMKYDKWPVTGVSLYEVRPVHPEPTDLSVEPGP